ncbi:TPA: GPI inositol deacylase [Trebouxia sp. C0005]
MSAFDGAILERQTIFVVDCVKWLRQHYRQTYAADMPVVLVGHSMGGLVARAAAIALASEAGSRQSILAIVTLAAPHQQAPANVHAPLHAFYSRLQRAAAVGASLGAADRKDAGFGKANVPLLSVAGGAKDMLVLPELNALTGVWPDELTVEADVRDMPGIWVSADHQSLVWCNQLVSLIARLLQSITQPTILALHSQEGAQSAVVQHMRGVTQPNVATALGLALYSMEAPIPSSAAQLPRIANKCPSRNVDAGSIVNMGHKLQVIKVSSAVGCSTRAGCWWQWNQTGDSEHQSWTLLMQGASPCRDFQVMHSRSGRQPPVDMTHTAVQLPDLTRQNRKGSASADSTLGRQTWLVRLRASGSISLWIGGDGVSDHAVRGTVQVSSDGVIVPQLWQLLNTGYKIQPPHAITARILLPHPSWLQALGMQLTIFGFRDRSQIPSGSDRSHNGRSWDSVTSATDMISRDDSTSRDQGILHQGHITDSTHAQTAIRETDPGRRGGPKSSQKAAGNHQCWQPVLLAYGQSATETMQSASAREVIRTNPAELSLWAIEAAGKEIGVLSDPSCVLHLKLEWEVRKAAANALRLHVAALPALAAALLLMRLALIILIHKAKNQQAVYLKDQPSSTHQSAHQRVNALSMSQTLVSLLDSSSKQVLQRGQLLGLTIIWGSMASWLWPQLALWANWMSHRRPTLPSVLGSVFLIVLTEGLLEALELVAMLMTTCCRLLRQLINKLIVMRSAKVAPCEPYKLQPENCGAQLPKLVRTTAISVIAAAITLVEARACQMLALLHALICHLWCAAHQHQPSKPVLVSSPRLGSKDTISRPQQQLQPEQQQGQGSEAATDATGESSGRPDAAAALATLQQQGMQTEAEDLSGRRPGMPDRQHGVLNGQPGVFDGQPDQQQQHQQAAQQSFSKPSVQEGVSHQHQMQQVHCKMLVCAIALQILPCVAWLKQLPHTRQLAAWQDAVPCAVLALHASISAMAVSLSLLVTMTGTEGSIIK